MQYSFELLMKTSPSTDFQDETDLWLGCSFNILVDNVPINIGKMMFYALDEEDMSSNYESFFKSLVDKIKHGEDFSYSLRDHKIDPRNKVSKEIRYKNNTLSFCSVIMYAEEERWDRWQFFEEVSDDIVSIDIKVTHDNYGNISSELINLGKRFDRKISKVIDPIPSIDINLH